MSSLDFALRETQTQFYCLDLKSKEFQVTTDDGKNLLRLRVQDAEEDGTLKYIASTYDHMDQVLRDGVWGKGRKVISFAHILQNETFPLSRILEKILYLGQRDMGRPVEIEFAVELNPDEENKRTFYLLQIRPIVNPKEMLEEDIDSIPTDQLILKTYNALGHGVENDIFDLVYVKSDNFGSSNNQLAVYEVEKMNHKLTLESRNYILIGPGRWGSSDPWLGIPVKWPHIAAARLIVEAGITKYKIDPSQGTHFFQNLTSFGVSYYMIDHDNSQHFCDFDYLNSQPAVFENDFIRQIRFNSPIVIKTDGRKGIGLVMKPQQKEKVIDLDSQPQ